MAMFIAVYKKQTAVVAATNAIQAQRQGAVILKSHKFGEVSIFQERLGGEPELLIAGRAITHWRRKKKKK